MINIIHFIKYLAVLLFSLSLSAQVSVAPSNIEYTNNGQPKSFVSGCGVIDLKSSTSTLIEMIVNISTVRSVINNSESKLYVYSKISPNAVRIQRYIKTIPSVNWIGQGSSTTSISYNPKISFFINAADFNATGGTLLLTFVSPSGTEYTSACTFQITKTPPPSFSFTPTSLSLACGDTAARTFTVTPANIPPGATVTYNWSAPGWTQVGSTTNSRTFQPSSGSILPSTISVTPIINGVAQPIKTCTVTRQAFASNSVISGANNLCTSATYTSNIVGATTFSWAITQGADKVTLAGNGTPIVTLTALPNASGMVTLSLTAGNACGSVTRTKSIQIGATSITTNNMVGPIAVYYNEIHNYYYAGQVPDSPSSTYNWFIYNGINDGVGPECGGQILSGQGSRNINLETGCNTGFLIVEITAKNCEIEETAFLFVDVSNPFASSASTTSSSTISTFPNPMTDSSNLQVDVIKTGATDTINDFSKIKVTPKAIDNQVKIYDFYGNLHLSTSFTSDQMSLSNLNLKSGKYILNVTTNSGEQIKTILIVK